MALALRFEVSLDTLLLSTFLRELFVELQSSSAFDNFKRALFLFMSIVFVVAAVVVSYSSFSKLSLFSAVTALVPLTF